MLRRSFLGSILTAGVAPAFVGAHVLMPVRPLIILPPKLPSVVIPFYGTLSPASMLEMKTKYTDREVLFAEMPASGGSVRLYSGARPTLLYHAEPGKLLAVMCFDTADKFCDAPSVLKLKGRRS